MQYRELAEALWSTEKNSREIRRITLDHPSLSIEDAYGILDQLILLKQGPGIMVNGCWKQLIASCPLWK